MRALFSNEVRAVSGGEIVYAYDPANKVVASLDPTIFSGNACYASDSYSRGASAPVSQRPVEKGLGILPSAGFTGVIVRVVAGLLL